ncbi:MAG: hypothetical protein ABIQ99_15260 [Thermoflexales bacterium]
MNAAKINQTVPFENLARPQASDLVGIGIDQAEHGGQGDADEADSRSGDGLENQTHDHAGE